MARASSPRPPRVRLDLNSPPFQEQFFALPTDVLRQVVDSFRRLRAMDWNDVYRSQGLKWEKIGRDGPNGEPLYSFRITQKVRAVGYRDGEFLRVISLHPDHNSAYDR